MFKSCERAQKMERPGDTGILPSWHFFRHVASAKGFAVSMAKSQTFPHYLAAREELFRDLAARNLRSLLPDMPKQDLENLASMIAGAFVGLMRRWMETGLTAPPEDLHNAFERFVRSVVRP